MLISVHLPKTAGSSFLAAIEQYYGERLIQDYGDRPINRKTYTRNIQALRSCFLNSAAPYRASQVECIHGHYMPLKYRYLRAKGDNQFVVWMRDPVERLASHYYYWTRNYNPIDAGRLHRRVVEEKWSLERFALGPEMQNMYSKFFWGFPLSRFDFVGITEHYDTDIDHFCQQILDAPLEVLRVNVNPERLENPYIGDLALREKIATHHEADMLLYRQALDLRQQRMSTVGADMISDS